MFAIIFSRLAKQMPFFKESALGQRKAIFIKNIYCLAIVQTPDYIKFIFTSRILLSKETFIIKIEQEDGQRIKC